MTNSLAVTIASELQDFVNHLVESGRYDSTTDVMSCALRLLQNQENQRIALNQALLAGEQSGESSLTLKEIAAQVNQNHRIDYNPINLLKA